ncbi:Glucose dehydrogenase/choline dehydrogenase/mandelonitrile lyase (GMC oxidoreductase family) [Handroanthus impetiginosus]|uniref:Glucose dehydrogenase/choline dehydrogenase/mandelonitrile lyase (GMC oxidoreductase family) n=1 Tax=Handroanthus impetiginosus TaxID=429701 RepID=A0A2G9IAP3_9LAMI|nr:Glucose dehydrogenase/choline dehydrogenase/mandelonitrile lyase (GMC oxidoreductase family) [Handroanthus impetiginosus]
MAFGRWFPVVAASMGIFFLVVSCFAEKAPYTSFAKDATLNGPTLSASAKALLLERGGLPYDYPNMTHITGFPATLAGTSPNSASQLFVSTDDVFNHWGRVLGSSSAINRGFFTHASREYSYEWVERKVAFQPRVLAWQAAVRDGLLEARVLPYRGFTFEHLHGTKIGGSIFYENGYRHATADLLDYADPSRITVYLRAKAQQILFRILPGQKPKAFEVFFQDSNGIKHLAYLTNEPTSEIILCAGALGNPQLLMLSVILDQPMVRKGMFDNPMNAVMVPSTRSLEMSLIEVVGITDVGSYIEAASGFMQLGWAHRMAQDFANFPWTILTTLTLPEAAGGSALYQNSDIQAGIILEKVMDPRDLQRCVEGMEIIRKVVESQPLSTFRYPFTSFQSLMNLMLSLPINLRRKELTASYSLEQFCTDTVMTIWHYHGGCQVNKVVDHDHKVLGVDALGVVDGSMFYNSLGTNPQATVMMIGRYMG